MTSDELEKVLRAAIRLDADSVNYLPTIVGDGGCETWHVYLNGERVGTIGEVLFKRLEDFRSKLRRAALLSKANVGLDNLLDGGVLKPSQASQFIKLVAMGPATLHPDAKVGRDGEA